MCEQGIFHVDKVKFDQVNNVGIGGGDHLVSAEIVGGRFLGGRNPNEWGPRQEGSHMFKRRARQP